MKKRRNEEDHSSKSLTRQGQKLLLKKACDEYELYRSEQRRLAAIDENASRRAREHYERQRQPLAILQRGATALSASYQVSLN